VNISIVMATYNGEQYLPEQLASLAGQTRRADEIIVFDDCSGDDSGRMLRTFAQENPEVRLHVNERNLGFRRNFHEALAACSGKLIFLCDQDDLWAPEKVEIMAGIMDRNPQINLLACNYARLLPDGSELAHSVFIPRFRELRKAGGEHTIPLYQVTQTRNLLDIPLPGCCYCVRRNFWEHSDRFWMEECPHDAVLWRYAALSDSAWIVDLPLVRWRKHETSAWKTETRSLDTRQEALKWRRAEMRDLRDLARYAEAEETSEAYRRCIARNQKFVSLRERFCQTRNPIPAFRLLGYLDLYPGVKLWMKDWMVVFH